jgi:UDP-N-acetylglucosamine 2-epimerase
VLRQQHREVLLHTGQHYDDAMSDRFFRELDIPAPDVELGVGSGTHGQQTARMLIGIEDAITQVRPDAVLLYGDTNSTLAGALAAAKMQVPVAHVEAGLRSFNRVMPEEINRTVTDALSALLFCPSDTAVANLRREGITNGVHLVGDVMWEVLNRFAGHAPDSTLQSRLGLRPDGYAVATVHRAENTDSAPRLAAVVAAINALSMPVLLPVHPRTKNALGDIAFGSHVHVVDPLSYLDMIAAVRHARVVLTDSGGLQKEAYWLGVPCVTLRDETEWPETVASGWNVLAGANADRIVAAVRGVTRPAHRPKLYGEGAVAGRIVALLEAGSCVREEGPRQHRR